VRSCYYSVALGALLSVVASLPARAETDLTGKWVGKFIGVQIEIPAERGPFGNPLEEGKGRRHPASSKTPWNSISRPKRKDWWWIPGPQASSKSTSSARRPVRRFGIA
jgi:hypothetical protein